MLGGRHHTGSPRIWPACQCRRRTASVTIECRRSPHVCRIPKPRISSSLSLHISTSALPVRRCRGYILRDDESDCVFSVPPIDGSADRGRTVRCSCWQEFTKIRVRRENEGGMEVVSVGARDVPRARPPVLLLFSGATPCHIPVICAQAERSPGFRQIPNWLRISGGRVRNSAMQRRLLEERRGEFRAAPQRRSGASGDGYRGRRGVALGRRPRAVHALRALPMVRIVLV